MHILKMKTEKELTGDWFDHSFKRQKYNKVKWLEAKYMAKFREEIMHRD